jgi:predicted dehydrogenase
VKPSQANPFPASSGAGLRVAIIGCGAVVERFHLPASKFVPELSIEILTDREEKRAAVLAAAYRVPGVTADFREIIGKVDAAIVALPHSLNASVSSELLNAGISVLVEKPMALHAAEGEHLVLTAERRGASLSVGYTRRYAYGVQFARRAIREGLIGSITGFSVEDGFPFDWKSAAPEFRLSNDSGGGVLLDFGCHVFDMLIFWFGGLAVKSSLHDRLGGVEVNALVELETQRGIRGTVELSWERTLRNTAIVEGTAGRLEIEWYRNNASVQFGGSTLRGTVTPEGFHSPLQTFDMMFVDQLREWAGNLLGRTERNVLATGEEATEVLRLVETCRDHGGIWQLPWTTTLLKELDG